jgi:hypothetical protein
MGKVKVRISKDFLLKLLHLASDNAICNARAINDCLEIIIANDNIPEGLYEGHIETSYVTGNLIPTKRID